jgi:hypothetical protein
MLKKNHTLNIKTFKISSLLNCRTMLQLFFPPISSPPRRPKPVSNFLQTMSESAEAVVLRSDVVARV